MMDLEDGAKSIAELLDEPGRPLDIGEQERDGPDGQLGHGPG